MTPNPLSVPGWVTVNQLMDEGVYKRRLSSFPVVDDNATFVGLVTLAQIRQIPTARWAQTTTDAVARTHPQMCHLPARTNVSKNNSSSWAADDLRPSGGLSR